MAESKTNPFVEGGRTKYKAAVRNMQQTIWAGLGKDPSEGLTDDQVAALAKVMETNKLTPARPDRRFPNTNQLNNCW